MASEASKPKKRPLEQDVSELQPSKEARVRGCLTSLSPIKNSAAGMTKYFEGQLSDSKGSCRILGFDPHIHQKLQTFHGGEDTLVLGNCHVKEGRQGAGLEVIIRNNSDIQQSPLKFNVQHVHSAYGVDVCLSDVPQLSNFKKVCTSMKVMSAKEPMHVGQEQDCVVADSTGSCKIILWEENIATLIE